MGVDKQQVDEIAAGTKSLIASIRVVRNLI
jgi:hypothetical protein